MARFDNPTPKDPYLPTGVPERLHLDLLVPNLEKLLEDIGDHLAKFDAQLTRVSEILGTVSERIVLLDTRVTSSEQRAIDAGNRIGKLEGRVGIAMASGIGGFGLAAIVVAVLLTH